MKYLREFILILFCVVSSGLTGFTQSNKYYVINNPVSGFDSIPQKEYKNPGISGIFISPFLGLEFPVSDFNTISKNGLTYGVKLEYANFKIYPVIIGVMYQNQLNKGKDDYLTANLLNMLDTKINTFGVSVDVILNKYLKSNFTIPFVTLELKYFSIQKTVSPEINNLNIQNSESFFGLTGGFGFTLHIFDIYGTYTYAKDYSSAAIKTRFHFPLLKF